MTSCLVDTNIWLRYFTKDDLKQYEECMCFFELVDEGKVKPYVSNVTLMEITYTLKTYYGFTKASIADYLGEVLKTRNLVVLEKTNSVLALKKMSVLGIKYTDCLIVGQLKKGVTLVSYDKDFDKLIPGQRKEPGDF